MLTIRKQNNFLIVSDVSFITKWPIETLVDSGVRDAFVRQHGEIALYYARDLLEGKYISNFVEVSYGLSIDPLEEYEAELATLLWEHYV